MTRIIIFLLLFPAIAYSANVRGTSESLYPPGTSVVQVFDNASTVGQTGTAVNTKFLPDQGTWELVVNGSPTAYEIAIEGSIRGTSDSWYIISTMTELDTVNLRHIYAKPVIWIRPKIVSKTGSGSFDLYIITRGN